MWLSRIEAATLNFYILFSINSMRVSNAPEIAKSKPCLAQTACGESGGR